MKKLPRSTSILLSLLFIYFQFSTPASRAQTRNAGKETASATGQPQLVAQVGHQGSVSAIAFSPDGSLILTAGADEAVLWEVATGRELRRFLGRAVQLEPFSEDARYVMTAYEEYTGFGKGFTSDWFTQRTEHLFDTATGREVRLVSPGTQGYWAVAISPDNHLVATADFNTNIVRLWDVETKSQLRQIAAFTKDLSGGLGFTLDGRYLLTVIDEGNAGQKARVVLWDPATGREVHSFAGEYLRQSPDGHLILTKVDNATRLWDVASGKELSNFENGFEATFSPDSKYLGVADGQTKKVHLYEMGTNKELRELDGLSAKFSRDGRFVMTQSEKTARLLNISDGTLVRSFDADATEFSPDSRFIVTTNKSYDDKKQPARLLETQTGAEVLRFDGYPEGMELARFSPDGRFVATASESQGGVRLWDISARREVRSFEGKFTAGSFDVSPDGRWVVTKSALPDKASGQEGEESQRQRTAAQLWDLSVGQVVQHFEFEGTATAFSPDSRYLLIDGRESALRDVATWQELRRFKGGSPLFLPGARLVATSDDDNMYISEVETARVIRRLKVQRSEDKTFSSGESFVTFSKDGRYGLTRGHDIYQGPRLWDLQTGRVLRKINLSPVGAVAFAPDGRSFLVGTEPFPDGGGGGDVCLYGVPRGVELRCYKGMGYGITNLAFTPDNRSVMASSMGNLTAFWNKTTGRLLRRLPGYTASLSSDGRRLLTTEQNRAYLWNTASGGKLMSFEHPAGISAIAFMREGRLALTSTSDAALRFWDTATGKELARLVASADGDWAVIAPDGHFDTNKLDDVGGLHWVSADAPFRTLPLKNFMHDYYESHLLNRILAPEPRAARSPEQ